MQKDYWLDLQLFADGGAPAGEGGGEAAGEKSADAGQSIEARLEAAGVPKEKIRKGAYRSSRVAQQEAQPAQEQPEEETQSGDADRKTWDEIKAGYKEEYDAEVQNIVQKRLKNSQEKIQQYEARTERLAPLVDFFAEKYGLDPDNPDVDTLIQKFREDSSLSEAFKRQQVNQHFDDLQQQAAELAKKVPGFNLMAELENDAFAQMTAPGSKVTVEQAYYALHPEFRQREAESVAKRATEAVAQSVRAGASRPVENGTQAASVGKVSYKSMSKADREALKQRIYAAGQRGEHLPYGG